MPNGHWAVASAEQRGADQPRTIGRHERDAGPDGGCHETEQKRGSVAGERREPKYG
jgi:hypothetical protein